MSHLIANVRSHASRSQTLLMLFIAVACGQLIGCGQRADRFVPSPNTAESALQKALDAWKSGQPSGPIADTSPLIYLTDNTRKASQVLNDYKIMGEIASRHGRAYMVELDLSHPTEKRKTEYILVGIDPLWVFRKEDYELLMHWDHHMPDVIDESPKS